MGREDDQFTFDLLVPGYNYCGPFNPEDNGEPVNFTDAACQRHDKAYKKLGPWAYLYFNKADAVLLEEIKDQTDIGAVIARAYFKRKRAWAALSDTPFPAHDAWTQEMGREEDKWKAWMKRGMDDQDFAERQARIGKRHKEEHDDSTHEPMYDGPPTPASSHTTNAEVSPDGSVRTRPPMEPRKLDMDSADSRRRPFNNSNGQSTMADKDTTPAVEGLMSAIAGGSSKGSHETPITQHAPQYGLKETATVILPFQAQCTIISPTDYEEMTQLKLRLNTPYDIIKTAVNVNATPTWGMGVYANCYPRGTDAASTPSGGTTTWGGSAFPATALAYPQPMANNEKPQWRQYWEKHYKVYAVVETEIIVRIKPLIKSDINRQGILGYGTDVSSLDGTRVNNLFPDRRKYREMVHWPGVSWKKIETQSDGAFPQDTVLRFNWKPGNLKKPVTNDEDVKTWTNVGSTPSMEEILVLWFGKSWENQSAQQEAYAVNVEVRNIVQFKDLDVNAYYPTSNTWSGAPSLNYAVNGDVLQAN